MAKYNIGTDTGGTYTDAVIVDMRDRKVIASAKALTTRGDLSIGVRYPGETLSVAIGQGTLLATPLQLAVMMAIIANRGRLVVPHLVDGRAAPGEPTDLDPAALDFVARALRGVVNEGGSGARARVRGLEIAGKTGTAQVVSQRTRTRSETLPYELRDHAWFASFAPVEAPELVVVVFVEHGGLGSRAAAPVAKKLYERYFQDRITPGT